MMGYSMQIWVALIVQTVSTIILDYILVSHLPGSLQLGVLGVALSNIGSSATLLLYKACAFKRAFRWSWQECDAPLTWTWLSSWWQVGRWTATNSLVRNFCYVFFILRMINVLRQPGAYWIANNFVWSWLLLPFTGLAEHLKQDVASRQNEQQPHLKITFAYFALVAVLSIVWLITRLGWPFFIQQVLNVQEPDKVVQMLDVLVPFYVLYMFDALIDSIFSGKGYTSPLAASSAISFGYYAVAATLIYTQVLEVTMTSITLLFGCSIAVGTLARCVMYWRFLHRHAYLL